MSRLIPKGSNRAHVQFVSRQLDTPSLSVDFTFPKDREEMESILEKWHDKTLGRGDARLTLDVLVNEGDGNVVPIIPRVIKQYCIDLHSILFIETHYYNDEPG